jgi:hypothetical protein
MAQFVASLPARTKVLKDLADALRTLIAAEREALGLNAEAASDGRPMFIVKDYTGRGSLEAPVGDAGMRDRWARNVLAVSTVCANAIW